MLAATPSRGAEKILRLIGPTGQKRVGVLFDDAWEPKFATLERRSRKATAGMLRKERIQKLATEEVEDVVGSTAAQNRPNT